MGVGAPIRVMAELGALSDRLIVNSIEERLHPTKSKIKFVDFT